MKKRRPRRNLPERLFGPSIGRRSFVKLTGMSLTAGELLACQSESSKPVQSGDVTKLAQPWNASNLRDRWSVQVLRARDFLNLELVFRGLQVTNGRLQRLGKEEARIAVRFPSQAIAEESLRVDASGIEPVLGVRDIVRSRISGPSALVYRFAEDVEIDRPYQLDEILELLRSGELVVPPAAGPNPLAAGAAGPQSSLSDQPRASAAYQVLLPSPGSTLTSIELPFRLFLSPHAGANFAHRSQLETSGDAPANRQELWHTRLGLKGPNNSIDEQRRDLRTVRAVKFRRPAGVDFCAKDNKRTFTLLDGKGGDSTLEQIVNQSAAPTVSQRETRPLEVSRLMLTALGGYLDLRGRWPNPPGVLPAPFSLEAWDHQATLGRDHYVRVVKAGYHFPLGHEMSLVKESQRKIVSGTAVIYTRSYIIVKQPVLEYGDGNREERLVPFRRAEFTQLETPNLHVPESNVDEPFAIVTARLGGGNQKPYLFPVKIKDRDGRIHEVAVPGVFVQIDSNSGNQRISFARRQKANALYAELPSVQVGAAYGYVPSIKPDDGSFDTVSFDLRGSADSTAKGFSPIMIWADVHVDVLRGLLNRQSGPARMRYASLYLDHGNKSEENKLGIALSLRDQAAAESFNFGNSSKNSGGFVALGGSINALSQIKGPVGLVGNDPQELLDFDASKYFEALADVKLFGTIPISAIIPASNDVEALPSYVAQAVNAGQRFLEDLLALRALLTDWLNDAPDALSSTLSVIFAAIEDAYKNLSLQPLLDAIGQLRDNLDALRSSLQGAPTLMGLLDGPRREALVLVDSVRQALEDDILVQVERFAKGIDAVKSLSYRLEWNPTIKPDEDKFFDPHNEKGLKIAVEARGKDSPGKPAGVEILASLEDFDLRLFGENAPLITLSFEKLQFRSSDRSKPEIDVIFKNIKFFGILSFVEKLATLIPGGGFSDPPDVDVGPEGITGSYSIAIPGISVGILSLENLSFSAGFRIPFIGEPLSANFGFCRRESPFTLSVGIFGGGGFFGITVNPTGLTLLEAAFEFGVSLSLNLGVASGGVSVRIGFYLALEPIDGSVAGSLTGYFRFRGEMSILGLISASIELRLELKYELNTGILYGIAILEIEVSVLCFSKTVRIQAERQLSADRPPSAGYAMNRGAPSNDRVLMADLLSVSEWEQYTSTFAA